MKKLSLIRILEDLDADLEAFSKEMEEGGEIAEPNSVNPQQVWGGQSLSDDPDQYAKNSGDVYSQHGITQQDMENWIDRISAEGFTPQIYQEISAKVGDVDNFMLDIQEAMPQIYSFFENSGLQNAIPKMDTNPQAAKKLGKPGNAPLSLQSALDSAGQASWDELADRGREIQYPDKEMRNFQKWREQGMRAKQFGQPPPQYPVTSTPPAPANGTPQHQPASMDPGQQTVPRKRIRK